MALTFYVIKGQRMASRRLPLSLGDPSDTDRPFSRLRRSSKKEENFLWIQQCMCRSCLFTQYVVVSGDTYYAYTWLFFATYNKGQDPRYL